MALAEEIEKWLKGRTASLPGEAEAIQELKRMIGFSVRFNCPDEWLVQQIKTKHQDLTRGMGHLSGDALWFKGAKLELVTALKFDLNLDQ